MLSFLLPTDIQISHTSDYILIKHKEAFFLKKLDKEVQFSILKTSEGNRLFAFSMSKTKASSAISHRYNLVFGLSRGYQQRLRLIGIGFRARINVIAKSDEDIDSINKVKFNIKNYIRNRLENEASTNYKFISIKLGYSHEVIYPISNDVQVNVSSIDSRSKGRIINLKSNNYTKLNKTAAEIRSFRYPDAYKGKGIYYNTEKLKLKKGKRQG